MLYSRAFIIFQWLLKCYWLPWHIKAPSRLVETLQKTSELRKFISHSGDSTECWSLFSDGSPVDGIQEISAFILCFCTTLGLIIICSTQAALARSHTHPLCLFSILITWSHPTVEEASECHQYLGLGSQLQVHDSGRGQHIFAKVYST